MKKSVLVEARDKYVWMPIVVVITDGDADVVARACESGLVGYIREDAVAIIAKQTVLVLGRVFLQRGDVGAVGEENIGTAVSVVVEYCNASGHCLRSIFPRGFVVLK